MLRPLASLLLLSCSALLLACLTGDASEVTIVGCGDHPCALDGGDGGDADGGG